MNITPEQLAEKPKHIGTLKGHKIFSVATKGGFFMVVEPTGTGFETLGVGPHPAIARHIAQKHEPDIVWSELSKTQTVDPDAAVVAKYVAITKQFRGE